MFLADCRVNSNFKKIKIKSNVKLGNNVKKEKQYVILKSHIKFLSVSFPLD